MDTATPPASPPRRPPFDSLPLDPHGPPANAWGLYGPDDELGALNLLSPAVVAAAASSEIRTGERVPLDWALNKPSRPSFGRPPFAWTLRPNGPGHTINDDELAFNTQCSSQWDGLRHFGYQAAGQFYGGRTQADLESSDVLGTNAIVARGGIVGRGVLLDYPAYCHRHDIPFDPLISSCVTLPQVRDMVQEQGVTFRTGDVLFLRVGFTAAYNGLSPDGQIALAQRPVPGFLGLESTAAVLRWLWETGVAAVAGDAPSWEQAPVEGHWRSGVLEDHVPGGGLLHQVLLGGWGMPIGEMFDLERLAATCAQKQRWTFFVASMPLHVPGGVASPPNGVALF